MSRNSQAQWLTPASIQNNCEFWLFCSRHQAHAFSSRTRESPHFPTLTRPIVKHIFGTPRGDDGAELAAEQALLA
jgi:hypothetical protein